MRCHYCKKATAELKLVRAHAQLEWEVRVNVCECCMCNKVRPLRDDEPISEEVFQLYA